MKIRKPIAAGNFYPERSDLCVDEIENHLRCITLGLLPQTIVAGIVPHSRWTLSHKTAMMVFVAIRQQNNKVDTFVLLGTNHCYGGSLTEKIPPVIDNRGAWATPLGNIAIDEELADTILSTNTVVINTKAHRKEYCIEMQIPFIQYLFKSAKILPIIVPSRLEAIALGESIGKIIGTTQKKIVCIASTELTYYGPSYAYTPMGTGTEAFLWARKVSDKKFIDLALNLEARELIFKTREDNIACGGGAVAAALAAVKKMGKTEGFLLAHTDSNEAMLFDKGISDVDHVGYVAMVF